MRKLLLGTTALAAAATLSANAALADVSISGYYEWKYQSTSADVTSQDGTTFGSDSEIAFKFTNKTDSGLDLGLTVEMYSDGDETNNTGEVIDRNEFLAEIFIKPARSINFITLKFIATRTGVAFEEVAG